MSGLHVYILTNTTKSVLYTGVTNDLERRLIQHYNQRGRINTFVGRYYCYYLVYHEYHHTKVGAIEREKQIKGWLRIKKELLISDFNPDWRFLNSDITRWPPEHGTF